MHVVTGDGVNDVVSGNFSHIAPQRHCPDRSESGGVSTVANCYFFLIVGTPISEFAKDLRDR